MSTLDQIIQAQTIKAAHVAALLLKQNVVACGVGYKISGDQITDTPSVVVSVARKLPVAQLASQDLVPRDLDGTPTDVVETGVLRAFDNAGPRDRWRPTVPPGVTIGHTDITAGTFGCLVRRGEGLFILSNNHVLADCNAGRPGDAILQPGRSDGGTDADKVAELADYVAINFDDAPAPAGCGASMMRLWQALSGRSGAAASAGRALSSTNEVDVALARPLSAGLVNANILSIGVPQGTAQATLGTQVQKSGRTTGHTSGRIIQIDVTARIAYENRTASFVNQLMADGMSQPGDSGAAVLDMARNVVGLLFAGSNNTTLINPIQRVLAALGVQIVTA